MSESHGGVVDRRRWVALMRRIAGPVLEAAAEDRLRESLPKTNPKRANTAAGEALVRTLMGIGPWLELDADDEEGELRRRFRELAARGLANMVDPGSRDYCSFDEARQNMVEVGTLAHGLLRSPGLWRRLDERGRDRLAEGLARSRGLKKPPRNNWLLFAAMVELFLREAGRKWRRGPIRDAVKSFERWYMGDGTYGDGEWLRWDYYNSYVIHPMLLELAERVRDRRRMGQVQGERIVARARRYACVLERLIGPDGSMPPMGRSITYRFGNLHALGDLAWREQLPGELRAGQVRSAMTAAMMRTGQASGTFDEQGWLTRGVAGRQESAAEDYISAGSVYMCCGAFVPLGLGMQRPFWSEPGAAWTAKRLYGGENVAADRAMKEE